jgi:hypothetical protein
MILLVLNIRGHVSRGLMTEARGIAARDTNEEGREDGDKELGLMVIQTSILFQLHFT